MVLRTAYAYAQSRTYVVYQFVLYYKMSWYLEGGPVLSEIECIYYNYLQHTGSLLLLLLAFGD